MASIRKYISKKGVITYNVQIRLKGYEHLSFSCGSYEEALKEATLIERYLKKTRLAKKLENFKSR